MFLRELFLLLSIFLLTGCNVLVRYGSEPPGAFLRYSDGTDTPFTKAQGQGYAPIEVPYPQSDEFKSGGCMYVVTPSAQWPDGAQLGSYRLQLCKSMAQGQTFIWAHTLRRPDLSTPKPAINIPQGNQPSPSNNAAVSNTGASIEDAKKKCADLGFKLGTEGFGNCVLKLSR